MEHCPNFRERTGRPTLTELGFISKRTTLRSQNGVLSYCRSLAMKRTRCYAASRRPERLASLKFEELCALLAAHFGPKPNAILQRYNFYSAYRTQGQPIKDFVAELNNLARNCEFGNTKPGVQLTVKLILEENLRDRLVCGVADMAVQRRLLSETDLDFAKAFQIALAMESATANAA